MSKTFGSGVCLFLLPLSLLAQDLSFMPQTGRTLTEKERKLQRELAQKQLKILESQKTNPKKALHDVYAETAKDCSRLKEVQPTMTKDDIADCKEFAEWSAEEISGVSDAQAKDLYALSVQMNQNILQGKDVMNQNDVIDHLFNGESAKEEIKKMTAEEKKAHEKFVELLKDPNFQKAMDKLQKAQDAREEAATADSLSGETKNKKSSAANK